MWRTFWKNDILVFITDLAVLVDVSTLFRHLLDAITATLDEQITQLACEIPMMSNGCIFYKCRLLGNRYQGGEILPPWLVR